MDASEFTANLKIRIAVGEQINDAELNKRLKQAVQDPAAYREVLEYLSRQISDARDRCLHPTKKDQPGPEEIDDIWMYLVSDIGHVIQKLYQEVQDTQLDYQKERRAQQVVLALRLLALARLYAIRATINKNAIATEVIENVYKQPQVVVKEFLAVLKDYDALVCAGELHQKLPRVLVGWKEAGDAHTYSAWSRDFGRNSDAEINWSLFAQAVGSELRYQSRKLQLLQRQKEVWHTRPRLSVATPLLFLKALAPWIFKITQVLALWIFEFTAGFGLKPVRFGRTVFATMFIFSILYFLDDAWARCGGVTWSLAAYGREVYNAIGNFTSIGANPGPCGPFRGMFISIETLIGYFLLSLLAAMLVGWLLDH